MSIARPKKTINASILTILQRLSLEEKIDLVSGKGLWRTAAFPHLGIGDMVMTDGTYGVRYSTEQIDQGEDWSFNDFIDVINQSAKHADIHNIDLSTAEKALPKAVETGGSESLFGRTQPATCFPNGATLACSWDRDLIFQMGQALGRECKALNVDLLLGPGINIRRTPLAGRGYEYYSEDPIVSAEIAIAMIQGIQSQGVGACLKHFACNNSEYRRTEMNSVVNIRALHDIYLLAFKRTIQRAKPWAVMSSYNRLNGVQVNESYELLTQILRDDWGYEGLVVSDWYGIKNRVASLLAGNDLEMPEVKQNKIKLLTALKNGQISEIRLDQSCVNILNLLHKTGKLLAVSSGNSVLPEAGNGSYYEQKIERLSAQTLQSSIDLLAHHKLAQTIAEQSIVLLKNAQNTLPITPQKYKKIAVIGKSAHQPVIQGSGSATTIPYYLDRPLDELLDLGAEYFDIQYAVGVESDNEIEESAFNHAISVAKRSDITLIFVNTIIGGDGENGDRVDLNILPTHENLIHHIAQALKPLNKRCVVILANPDAVIMPWIDQVDAVLETFFAGQGVGRAVANILFGHVNPSGKLTVTVPNSVEELPAYLYYPGEGNEHYYSEGIFVGYRYYDKRKIAPLFPFGFGLSYSTFSYRGLALSSSVIQLKQPHINKKSNLEKHVILEEVLRLNLTIENLGPFDGQEIVQVYLQWPSTHESNLPREDIALKAFAKQNIPNGQLAQVDVSLYAEDFTYYHPTLKKFVIDSGNYTILVGSSSRDIQLIASLNVEAEPYIIPLEIDCSLVQLIQQPLLFNNVVSLVAKESGQDEHWIRERFIVSAPNLFCGLYITLTEFFQIHIDEDQLRGALTVHIRSEDA